jgi:hypothetical protein
VIETGCCDLAVALFGDGIVPMSSGRETDDRGIGNSDLSFWESVMIFDGGSSS